MDDGYSEYFQASPSSPGHDIGPDEDRNCVPTCRCNHIHDGEGDDFAGMLNQDGMFIECLDETPDNLTDITDMQNRSLRTLDESLYHEVNRLKTFEGTWHASYFVQPNDLAKNGFIYFGPGDKVKCVFCLKTLWKWQENDSVELEHRRHYPNCPFVQGNCDHLNVPVNTLETSLGLHMKPQEQKLPPPCNYSNRLKSYQRWPKHDQLRPEALAEAGFFYLGEGDQVKCFSCEKVLSNWKPGDDPWCEHALWSPACLYIQSVKGTEFIDKVCGSQSSPGSSTLGHSMAVDGMNAAGSEAQVAISEREDTLGNRSQKLQPMSNGVDLAAQVENDMNSPAVVAMMTFEIPVEEIRERLTQIKLTKGLDYTVTSRDFLDLMN